MATIVRLVVGLSLTTYGLFSFLEKRDINSATAIGVGLLLLNSLAAN